MRSLPIRGTRIDERRGMEWQDPRLARFLREIEVAPQIAENRDVLTHGRSRVGATVRRRVDALSV